MNTKRKVTKIILYVLLACLAVTMLVPFYWMVISSLKLNKDVFTWPMEWIPSNPQWANYINIWTKIPLLKYISNTAILTVVVTLLQLLTSSFAAYAFAKMDFKGKNLLFLGYIATIAVPWQVYMVPQFMMMRAWHLNNTHLAIICLQAFSAFGVFLMKQFYEGGALRAVRGCPDRWADGVRHLVPGDAAPVQAGAVHPDHLHVCEHLERFFGPADLPDPRRGQDHPDRPAHVHQPILR